MLREKLSHGRKCGSDGSCVCDGVFWDGGESGFDVLDQHQLQQTSCHTHTLHTQHSKLGVHTHVLAQ